MRIIQVAAAAAFAVSLSSAGMAQTPNAEICAALAKTEIPAGSIGLPTTGASILTAAMVAANEPNNPNGDYCKVTGAIRPVDPKEIGRAHV